MSLIEENQYVNGRYIFFFQIETAGCGSREAEHKIKIGSFFVFFFSESAKLLIDSQIFSSHIVQN